jgi:hypothetical protein
MPDTISQNVLSLQTCNHPPEVNRFSYSLPELLSVLVLLDSFREYLLISSRTDYYFVHVDNDNSSHAWTTKQVLHLLALDTAGPFQAIRPSTL